MLEQELKLSIAPRHLSQVLKLPAITRHATRRAHRHLVRSFYYDTPDLDLRRQGLELRVRKVEGRWVQTVKSRAGRLPGFHERLEVESPVSSAQPDLSLLSDHPVANLFAAAGIEDRLERMFETRFWRRHVPIRFPDGTVIEICVDSGGVHRETEQLPICEVELELKRGLPQSLYELARQLSESIPLSLATLERADLGYRLVGGQPPVPVVSSIPEVTADMAIEEALAAIFAVCLEQALGNEEVIMKGSDVEGVHQMRVALRRLRSCLVMFRRVLPRHIGEHLRQSLKPLLAVLGPARDWDVFLTEQGGTVLAALPDRTHLQELFDAARQCQTEAYVRLRAAMRGADYRRHKLHLSAWIACREWRAAMNPGEMERLRQPLGNIMDGILQRGHKRVLQWGRKIRHRSIQDLHRLRIAVKRQRYAVEFFSGCHPRKKVRGYLEALRCLQEELGHLNDGATARQLLGQLKDVPDLEAAIQFVEGWNAHAGEELKRRLPPLWKSFRREKSFWKKPARPAPKSNPIEIEPTA